MRHGIITVNGKVQALGAALLQLSAPHLSSILNLRSKDVVMRIAKEDVPVMIDVPGATARHKTGFGDATGFSKFGAEWFSMGAGTDLEPLLHGLEGNMCQSPHWGYMLEGELTVTFADGTEETCRGGDLFYWPPGHSVKVAVDAEIILFSPSAEHCQVINHIKEKVGG